MSSSAALLTPALKKTQAKNMHLNGGIIDGVLLA
jgi:hypothetical protein